LAKVTMRCNAIGAAVALSVGCGGATVEPVEPGPTEPAPSTTGPLSVSEDDMTQVAGHLERGDANGLRGWLAASRQVTVALADGNCDEEEAGPEACVQRSALDGADAVATWLAEMAPRWSAENCGEDSTDEQADRCHYPGGFDAEGTVRCDAGCCSIEREGILHNTLFLDRVCFEAGGERPHVTSIDFTEG
jgi:hypothetical protein